jgi:glycosyltransferase involved in cell wall biosynthesis
VLGRATALLHLIDFDEPFGFSVVEAMACGTPVLTGDVPALNEVAGGAVAQTPELTAEALGAALVSLARDACRRE